MAASTARLTLPAAAAKNPIAVPELVVTLETVHDDIGADNRIGKPNPGYRVDTTPRWVCEPIGP